MSATVTLQSPPDVILDAAADVITETDRHIGDYWAGAPASHWQPGQPCDVTAAIGIACGLTKSADIDQYIVPAVIDGGDDLPHPAFAALMAHRRVDSVNAVFAWSDRRTAAEIAHELRACAAALRGARVSA